ncbi:MAG: nuclear transport factor 2 family protein [Pseudomonadota bacterium]|nr:nuclear transport factor 2 family protein [Pseudomonadota bacterium]
MTLSLQDRLDISDLFARYVHTVDSNQADAWVGLFTPDGVFDIPGAMRMEGRDQLRGMVATVAEHGGGKWRHQITNILAEPGAAADEARVIAYGLVTDWGRGGAPMTFTDYRIRLRKLAGAWHIEELIAGSVAPPPGA